MGSCHLYKDRHSDYMMCRADNNNNYIDSGDDDVALFFASPTCD